MPQKTSILGELGAGELLLPEQTNAALIANDRIKYYFTLLQAAKSHADAPNTQVFNLKQEREAAAIANGLLDRVIEEATKVEEDHYRIPSAELIFSEVRKCMQEMILPLASRKMDPALMEIESRYSSLMSTLPTGENDIVSAETILKITSVQPGSGDSLHLLVMDVHKILNSIQRELAQEQIDGALTYLLNETDKPLIRAFMAGLNRTRPLKFDHPGLGTTASRFEGKLVIQNDIGMTEAHVLVITVEKLTVTITYTDVHLARLRFFQSLFEKWNVEWNDTVSKTSAAPIDEASYFMSIGKYTAANTNDLKSFLNHLGSRLVFLIDWNKGRKQLRRFLRNRDAVQVLKWGAENEVGHRAFLELGGASLIYGVLEPEATPELRMGEPLHRILGRTETVNFFQWVLQTTKEGLLNNSSRLLIRDEVRAELFRFLRSSHQQLIDLCEEHASLTVEVATALRDSLLRVKFGNGKPFASLMTTKAKQWESRGDEIVQRVRTLSKRMKDSGSFSLLIGEMDDVLDSLEEACFMTTLMPEDHPSPRASDELLTLSEIALGGTRELLRTLMAAETLHTGGTQSDVQDFLRSADAITTAEMKCDEGLRRAENAILAEASDFKQLWVYTQAGRSIEQSTNYQRKGSYLLRDMMLEEIRR
ncbi:MAG TPA: hypothetical protein VLV31_04140 [Candidatus Acidoferrales bacterium]|nr:hypothetical protein [Candidatus Acidoferrales bacterium]